ncbi:MAG: BrnT family toxin, partial [Dehalococcoidia bacterium]
EEAFEDPGRVVREAYNTPMERRRGIVGVTRDGRLLTVIYTIRRGMIRVISAWDADERDARRYRRRRR